MNKQVIVYLKPVDKYFFGTETTFGDERKNQNYLVHSMPYPQQTSLLGMLRFELLKQNQLLPLSKHAAQAENLIGKKSFDASAEQTFGVIEKISPLFVEHKKEFLYFGNQKEELTFSAVEGNCFLNGAKTKIPFLTDYDAKKHYEPVLFTPDNKIRIAFDKVFISDSQVGISKTTDDDEADAFYKQTFFRMKNGFRFAFILNYNTDYKHDNKTFSVKLENTFVTLGGEKSQFEMKIEDFSQSFTDIFAHQKLINDKKVVLLSDAFVTENIYDKCTFAITETQDFRFVKTEVAKSNTNNYDAKPVKSDKYNMLKRGSVFFVEDRNSFVKNFENLAFQNIGYNSVR